MFCTGGKNTARHRPLYGSDVVSVMGWVAQAWATCLAVQVAMLATSTMAQVVTIEHLHGPNLTMGTRGRWGPQPVPMRFSGLLTSEFAHDDVGITFALVVPRGLDGDIEVVLDTCLSEFDT